MGTELAQQQSAPPAVAANDTTAIIQVIERAAMNPDVDIDKMERLLQMQERVMERQAAMDYSAAMAAMQTEMPSIAERGKIVVKGELRSKYATLEDIVDTVRPIMQKHGFAISFRINTLQNGIEVTGVLMHKGGHREETTMLLPSDMSGSKNAVQAFGSTTSYGKRYVLSALLNITTRDEDDDGNAAAPVKTVTPAQAAYVKSLLAKCPEITQDWFAREYGEPEDLPRSKYDGLTANLNQFINQQNGAEHADPQS